MCVCVCVCVCFHFNGHLASEPGLSSSPSVFILLLWNRRFGNKCHRFLRVVCPSCHPIYSVKAIKGAQSTDPNYTYPYPFFIHCCTDRGKRHCFLYIGLLSLMTLVPVKICKPVQILPGMLLPTGVRWIPCTGRRVHIPLWTATSELQSRKRR